ncbi:glutamate-cysteine ligase family protein [Streptomyces sp. GD-15H]|uniref:glutamate-cysteine ligase family protein n=1 Tax=Streptomyces sp. GD-15H TaxID=3129112 RepID=UPI00324DFE0F
MLDVASVPLVPRARAVLDRWDRPDFTTELQPSVVETNSQVPDTLDALYADLARTRRRLDEAASSLGLSVVASGTAAPPPVSAARGQRRVG